MRPIHFSLSLLSLIVAGLLIWTINRPCFSQCTLTNTPRVISLTPSTTELMYDLGLEEFLVAVDQNSNYPRAVKQLPNIGNPFLPNSELLALYKPNLVLTFSTNSALETAAKQVGFDILALHPTNMHELFKQSESLLHRFNRYETGITQLNSYQGQWQVLQQQYASQTTLPKVFIMLGSKPMYTLGNQTFLTQSLKACGTQGLFDHISQPSFIISDEQLLLNPPDKVLVGINIAEDHKKRRASVQNALRDIGLSLTDSQIILFDEDILFRPTFRFLTHLPLLCEQLNQAK